jgi:hypothetical protein
MHITPKVSNDSVASEAQSSSTPARRGSESQNSSMVPDTLDIQSNVPAAATEATDSDLDVADTHAADQLMNSLRSGILSHPGEAMLAQANLPSQSVYDLLQ